MHEPNPSTPQPTLGIGDKLEQYEIIQQIAVGGCSVVYRGYDALLGQDVAIKQLMLDADAANLDESLTREVEVLRRLSDDQPHIVNVIQAIHNERGAFVVTEYVHGANLQQAMSRAGAAATVASSLKIIAMTAQALAVMHQRGIVHRDLKPANILLPDSGGLKVCDVGLATLVEKQDRLALGSVQYMAPELLRGEPVDARADVYSLGMIAYQLLAGPEAFSETFKAIMRAKNPSLRWMKWHTNPRLAAPPIEQLNHNVPGWLAELITRMLAKNPADRLASAAQIEQAVRRHLDPSMETAGKAQTPADRAAAFSESPHDPPPMHTAKLPAHRSRRRGLAIAVGSLLVLIIGVLTYQSVAHAGRAAVRRQAIITRLHQARAAYNAGHFDAAAAAYNQLVRQKIADATLHTQALRGQLLAQAQDDLDHQRYENARRALNQLNQLSGAPHQTVRQLLDLIGRRAAFARGVEQIHQAIDRHNFAKTRRLIRGWASTSLSPDQRQAIRHLRVTLADQLTQQQADRAIAQADKLIAEHNYSAAIRHLKVAAATFASGKLTDKLKQVQTQQRLIQLRAQATRAEAEGNLPQAIKLYRQARAIRDSAALRQNMRKLQSIQQVDMGEQYAAAGKLAKARQAFTRALGYADNARAKQWLSKLSATERRTALIDAGDKAAAKHDFAGAVRQYKQAAAIRRDGSLTAKLHHAEQAMYLARGRGDLAADQLADAQAAFEKAAALNPKDPAAKKGLASVKQRLTYQKHLAAGDALRAKSDFAGAMRQYRQARLALDTKQIDQRMNDTEFAHLLAQAKSYIAEHHYHRALMILQTAEHLRNSPVLQRLLKQVNSKLSQESGHGG